MAVYRCPGAQGLSGTPTWVEKTCPECGRIIEIFSVDPFVTCECGFVAYNDMQSCIRWCAHAKDCVGEEIYDRFVSRDSS